MKGITERRIAKAVASSVKSRKESNYQKELKAAKEKIVSHLERAGITVDVDFSPSLVNPESINGLNYALGRLCYDPQDESPHLPWFDTKMKVQDFQEFVRTLEVPSWAEWFRDQTANGITIPSTLGMIKRNGLPNKDLKQLTSVTKDPKLNKIMLAQLSIAIDVYVERFMNELRQFPENDFFSIGEDGVIIKLWTYEMFLDEMSDAIAHSSPGYPYNGYAWSDSIEGVPITRLVYQDGLSFLDNATGFLFIQGARYTGDGDDDEGSQRLVMQACACEKLIGHMIAYALKKGIRYRGSGQLGIDAASRDIKDIVQGVSSQNYADGTPMYAFEGDLSLFDAHWRQVQHDIVKRIEDKIFSPTDEFTVKVRAAYDIGFENRSLLTGVGLLRTEMLPSGSSMTTVRGFELNTTYAILADIRFHKCGNAQSYKTRIVKGITSMGFMSDDLWMLIIDPRIRQTLSEVYGIMGCRLKENARIQSLEDDDACMVFLNQLIHLKSDHPNVVIPRWNCFYSESAAQNYQTVSLDRTILSEIKSKCPHPTSVELTYARLYGKLERYRDMPFFDRIVRFARDGGGRYSIRSWLGERTSPDSYLTLKLQELEKEDGITWPDEAERCADREQSDWMSVDQVLLSADLLFRSLIVSGHIKSVKRLHACAVSEYKSRRTVNRITRTVMEEIDIEPGSTLVALGIQNFVSLIEKVTVSIYEDTLRLLSENKSSDNQDFEIPTPKEKPLPTAQKLVTDVATVATTQPFALKVAATEAAYRLWADTHDPVIVGKLAKVLTIPDSDVIILFEEIEEYEQEYDEEDQDLVEMIGLVFDDLDVDYEDFSLEVL